MPAIRNLLGRATDMAQRVSRRSKRLSLHWHFVSWLHWSLGLSIDWVAPSLEVHLPFGFLAIGWEYVRDCADTGRWFWEPDATGNNNSDNGEGALAALSVGSPERQDKKEMKRPVILPLWVFLVILFAVALNFALGGFLVAYWMMRS
jgi:hypothetical protein